MALAGEVAFIRVFDLCGTMDLKKARTLLGPMVESSAVTSPRAAPDYIQFTVPLVLDLTTLNLELKSPDGGPVSASARLYEAGALAITLRQPIEGEQLSELSRYAPQEVTLRGKHMRRAQAFTQIFEELKTKLLPSREEVFDPSVEEETYTAYCLTLAPGGAERMFSEERPQLAALLIGDPQPERLSQDQIEEILKNWSSYYRDDLVVADWDAALLVEPNSKYEDLLYIFEAANMQLLLLRKYDYYLDVVLERGYDEFERVAKYPTILPFASRRMLHDLSLVRMDLAEVTDELANAAKFFGDWYVARVYLGLKSKLHVADYQSVVEEKLRTLNELYESVLAEVNHRQSLLLEITVVLLILIEIGLSFRH